MEIRKATMDDYGGLKEIKLLSKKEELKYSDTINTIKDNKKDYFRYLKKDLFHINRGMFIAIDKKKIVGMVLAQHFKPLPISKYKRKGYISNLYVMEKYRGKGIGNKLLKKAMGWLKKNKVEHITLEIHKENKIALKLYHNFGFKDYTIKLSKKI